MKRHGALRNVGHKSLSQHNVIVSFSKMEEIPTTIRCTEKGHEPLKKYGGDVIVRKGSCRPQPLKGDQSERFSHSAPNPTICFHSMK